MSARNLGYEHGQNAYYAGTPLVPHFDANVALFIEQHSHSEIIAYLKNWQLGFITAQLAPQKEETPQ